MSLAAVKPGYMKDLIWKPLIWMDINYTTKIDLVNQEEDSVCMQPLNYQLAFVMIFFIADGQPDSLFIEIDVQRSKNIIVGIIHRPPDSDIIIFKINLEKPYTV